MLNSSILLLDWIGLDIVDNIIQDLNTRKNELQGKKCTFVFAVDQPGGKNFSTLAVQNRIIRELGILFPSAKIIILSGNLFNAPTVIRTLNRTKCICGFYYIGHANNEGRARIIFDPQGTSLNASISPEDESPNRFRVSLINGNNFDPFAVSGIIGCNSGNSVATGGGGRSGPTITPSFAKTFSDQTNTTVWGTTSSVNLNSNGEITKGGFWEREENGIRFN